MELDCPPKENICPLAISFCTYFVVSCYTVQGDMEIGILTLIIVIAFFIFYFLFLAPKSDLIFSSALDEEVRQMKHYLEGNGIEVYIKGMDMQRLHGTAYDLVNPTLHVVRPEDRPRALELIRQLKGSTMPPKMDPR